MRYRKSIVLLWLLFCMGSTFAQPYANFRLVGGLGYNTFDEAYLDYLRVLTFRNAAIPEDRFNVLAASIAYSKSELSLALEYEEINQYLTQILIKLYPERATEIAKMKVKLVKDASYNAFTFIDGSIFFNIGLFAEIENEAALASVLGHEYSHYIFKDAEEDILRTIASEKEEKKAIKKGTNNYFKRQLKFAHFNQNQERRADSIGYLMAMKAGYNIKSERSTLMLIFEEEQHAEATKSYASLQQAYVAWNENKIPCNKAMYDFLSSHPESTERIVFLENFLTKNKLTPLEDYILKDKNSFSELQKKCKIETLKILLNDNDFEKCINKAFRFHLFEPNEAAYVYFILESIRRSAYLDPLFGLKGFLAEGLKDYLPNRKGITSKISLLLRDTLKLNDIKASDFRVGMPVAFNTYAEAFTYFINKKDIFENCDECLLVAGLYNYQQSKPVFKDYLNKYMQSPNVDYKAYAQAILNNSILQGFSKDLVYIEDIDFYTYDKIKLNNGQRETYFFNDFERAKKENDAVLNSFELRAKKVLENTDIINPVKLKQQNYAAVLNFENLINTVYYLNKVLESQYSAEKINVFVFSPDIWNLCRLYNIKTVKYLKSNSSSYSQSKLSTNFYYTELGLPQVHLFAAAVHSYGDLDENLLSNIKKAMDLHKKNHAYECDYSSH